jgi:hypothetical protein
VTPVEEVYALIARRDLRDGFRAFVAAKQALPAVEGAELLALHEAIVDSLDALLTELGEHGLEADLLPLDLSAWVTRCAASWREVERLRASGLSSEALIAPWVGGWMDPIGSRDWVKRMRLSVKHHQDPEWLARMVARVAGAR